MDRDRKTDLTGGRSKERTFPSVALDQMDRGAGLAGQQASEDQTRKTATAAEIEPPAGVGEQGDKLRRIGDMAPPYLGQGRRRNQVFRWLSFAHQGDQRFETGKCFT